MESKRDGNKAKERRSRSGRRAWAGEEEEGGRGRKSKTKILTFTISNRETLYLHPCQKEQIKRKVRRKEEEGRGRRRKKEDRGRRRKKEVKREWK